MKKKESLSSYYKYYELYKKSPFIACIIIASLCFIWAILDPVIFCSDYYGFMSHSWGVMRLSSGFLCWLIWVVIGAVLSVSTYFISKIMISLKVLEIEHLMIIAENTSKKEIKNQSVESVTKTNVRIVEKWKCDACGHVNNGEAFACINCGKSKFLNNEK